MMIAGVMRETERKRRKGEVKEQEKQRKEKKIEKLAVYIITSRWA